MTAGRLDAGRHPRHLWLAVAGAVAVHVATVLALRPMSVGATAVGTPATVMITRLVAPAAAAAVGAVGVEAVLAAPETPVTESAQATVVSSVAAASVAPSAALPPVTASTLPLQASAPMPAPTMAPATTAALPGSAADQAPYPLDDIHPAVPTTAGGRGGSVTLRLVISERGDVEQITIIGATPAGLFEESALAAFRQARYAPALRGSVPVRSAVTYQVDFAPPSTGADTSGKTY